MSGNLDIPTPGDDVDANAIDPALFAEMVAAFDKVWNHAQRMRRADRLVGPYPDNMSKNAIWVRALYHEGRDLTELLKPIRAILAKVTPS